MQTLERIKEQAMTLVDSERAQLAMDLLVSLPHVLEDADDGLVEAERRDAEMDADPGMSMTLEELNASLGR